MICLTGVCENCKMRKKVLFVNVSYLFRLPLLSPYPQYKLLMAKKECLVRVINDSDP